MRCNMHVQINCCNFVYHSRKDPTHTITLFDYKLCVILDVNSRNLEDCKAFCECLTGK